MHADVYLSLVLVDVPCTEIRPPAWEYQEPQDTTFRAKGTTSSCEYPAAFNMTSMLDAYGPMMSVAYWASGCQLMYLEAAYTSRGRVTMGITSSRYYDEMSFRGERPPLKTVNLNLFNDPIVTVAVGTVGTMVNWLQFTTRSGSILLVNECYDAKYPPNAVLSAPAEGCWQ